MSIVRVGLAETRRFAEGYDAIFGKKEAARPVKKARAAFKSAPAKNQTGKKKKKTKKK